MTMTTVTVAACQLEPTIGEVEANLAAIEAAMTDAAARGAAIAVAPECAVTGYVFDSADEALAVARRAATAGDRLAELAEATGLALIVGTLEAQGDEVFNTALLITPEGRRWHYRKTHLPYLGVDRFVSPGDDPPWVADVAGIRIGVLICYDLRFPEAARVCALDGADLIALPTNWPQGVDFHPDLFVPARANENHCYLLAADRIGTERGTTFIGRSRIVDPLGRTMVEAGRDEAAIITAEVDPARARTTRYVKQPGEHEWDTIADRRPGLYARLLEPGVDRRREPSTMEFSAEYVGDDSEAAATQVSRTPTT
jgi:5-aminopentanamidase